MSFNVLSCDMLISSYIYIYIYTKKTKFCLFSFQYSKTVSQNDIHSNYAVSLSGESATHLLYCSTASKFLKTILLFTRGAKKQLEKINIEH